MLRRDFLKGLAALPAAAALPALPQINSGPSAFAVALKEAYERTRQEEIASAFLHTIRTATHGAYASAGYIQHQTLVDIKTNKHYIRQTMAGGQWSDWKEMSSNV